MMKTQPPVIYGIRWFPGATKELIDTFPRLLARQDDIYISTYPKAGTTWTQELVWQIINDGKIDHRRLDIRMPWLDGMIIRFPECPYPARTPDMLHKMFESFPAPRVFKTHLPYDLVPKPVDQACKPRHIYVMRNPKDTAVSWYYHYLKLMTLEAKPTWNEFFESFLTGEVFYGSWFDHVLGWWKRNDDPSILFLKFEEMKKDLRGTIERIAKFIGKELSDESVERIAVQTTFPRMKQEGNANYTWIKSFEDQFLRKGQVGDWRNVFTQEQSDRLDALYAEKMAGSGLVFEYREQLDSKY